MEAVAAEQGKACKAPKGSLRHIARHLLIRASEETAAAKEIGDRLDGRPGQAIAHSGAVGSYDLTKVKDGDLDALEAILRAASVTGGGDGGEDEAGD